MLKLKWKKKYILSVIVYYQINKFYQNHRYYVKSKKDEQIHEKKIDENVTKDDYRLIITNYILFLQKIWMVKFYRT